MYMHMYNYIHTYLSICFPSTKAFSSSKAGCRNSDSNLSARSSSSRLGTCQDIENVSISAAIAQSYNVNGKSLDEYRNTIHCITFNTLIYKRSVGGNEKSASMLLDSRGYMVVKQVKRLRKAYR